MSFDLILLIRDIYINSSNNSLAAAEALSLNISFHETSPKWSHRDHSNQHENCHMLSDETRYCFEFYRKSIETEKTTWSDFPNGENTIVGQILEPEEINKSKRVELQESQLEIRVGKLNIWVRSFEINCKTMHMSNGILKG